MQKGFQRAYVFLMLPIFLFILVACGTDANDIDISDVDIHTFQISISVDGNNAPNLVRAGVAAIDENRNDVRLSADEIRIFESKDRENWQEVEFQSQRRGEDSIPISVAVAMDYSGSMDENQREDTEDAVSAFLGYLQQGDRMAIIKFAEDVKVVTDFTDDTDKLEDAIVGDPLGGIQIGTAIWDAADKGVGLAKDENAPKAVIITSDGEDNNSDTKASEMIDHAVKKGVPIFTLGFEETDDTDGMKYLFKVSEETGGLFYYFSSTSQMESVYKAIADVFEEAVVATWSTEMDPGTVYVKVTVNTNSGDKKSAVSAYSF